MQVAIRVPYFLSNYCTRAGDMLTLSQSAGKSVELDSYYLRIDSLYIYIYILYYNSCSLYNKVRSFKREKQYIYTLLVFSVYMIFI